MGEGIEAVGVRSPTNRRRALLPLALFPLAIIVLAALALSALLMTAASAQQGPSIVETQIVNEWPRELDFSALVDNGDALSEAILFYTVLPEGALTRRPAEIARGDVTRVTASVPTNRDRIWIPAGAEIEWYWELTAVDGGVEETDLQLYRYEDPHDWREVREGNLSVFYYQDESTALQLLGAGNEAMARISELLQVELDIPVRVYVWSNPGDARGVENVQSETFDEQVLTGGTRVLADLLHVFAPTRWIVQHELTHVLTKIAGEGGLGSIPAWLNEGVATYAEGDWRSRRGRPVDFAVENDLLLSVRSMGSTSNEPGEVDLFYGQSADLVTFLIDQFGEEQLAELFAVFKRGSTVDNALQSVYGFDRDGLDDRYRQSLGLEARVRGEDRSTRIEDDESGVRPGGDTETAEEPATPATAPAEDEAAAPVEDEAGTPAEEETATAAARSDEQIEARRAEIERRRASRRAAPSFGGGADFPWDEVATGLGGGMLLLSVALFWLMLGGRPAQPAAVEAGPEEAAPPRDREWAPPDSPPAVELSTSEPAVTPAATPPPPAAPGAAEPHVAAEPPASEEAGDSEGDTWAGWRGRESDEADR